MGDAEDRSQPKVDLLLGVADFAARAQENKLKPDELQSGTFTITNHGVSGSLTQLATLTADSSSWSTHQLL